MKFELYVETPFCPEGYRVCKVFDFVEAKREEKAVLADIKQGKYGSPENVEFSVFVGARHISATVGKLPETKQELVIELIATNFPDLVAWIYDANKGDEENANRIKRVFSDVREYVGAWDEEEEKWYPIVPKYAVVLSQVQTVIDVCNARLHAFENKNKIKELKLENSRLLKYCDEYKASLEKTQALYVNAYERAERLELER